ncbi:hypothetical protein [Paraglaciecola sp.]|uniref:hypothetical protein n=1 Tax=Paraglaciecola sp. TaxID=1920173 RepID=UPI003EF93C50
MKFFTLFFITFMSSNTLAEVIFKGCESLACKQLLSELEGGIPIYSGDINTGSKLDLDVSAISKILQSGTSFQLCVGTTTIYKINYACIENNPCRFISDGSISKSRTQFEACL